MPPKPATRKQLERIAESTARALSKEYGQEVICEYVGQRSGDTDNLEYIKNPAKYKVPDREWHSQTTIAFQFRRGDDTTDWELQSQKMNNVLAKSRVAPLASWNRISLQALQDLAARAAEAISEQLGEEVKCRYLGQDRGARALRRYLKDPRQWMVPKGQKHSQQSIA